MYDIYDLTRVGHIPKKVTQRSFLFFLDHQKEIAITSEIWRIFQPNFTG